MRNSFSYDMPLFRPPSEANSVIIQITYGCSWNRCAFCEMYSSKQFRVKPMEHILEEIDIFSSLYPDTRKIFLADGNPFVLKYDLLKNILEYIQLKFRKVNRISTYALPADVLRKSHEELQKLNKLGLKLLYVGIESGDDEVLKYNLKSEDSGSTVAGLKMVKDSGIKLSVMIINGLGGKDLSEQHAINSARVVNEIQPEFLSTLVLSFPYDIPHYESRLGHSFQALGQTELLKELRLFLKHTELDASIFRSDHASNYLPLRGVLSKDRDRLISQIDAALAFPEGAGFRAEWQRGL